MDQSSKTYGIQANTVKWIRLALRCCLNMREHLNTSKVFEWQAILYLTMEYWAIQNMPIGLPF